MTSTPEPLPSPPPSPGPSTGPHGGGKGEDVAHAWHEDDPSSSSDARAPLRPAAGSTTRSRERGKGKERAGNGSEDDHDEQEEDEEDVGMKDVAAGYPPTKDEEAESRRVAETLRRWEIAERQRRKAARESQSLSISQASPSGGTSTSLFADLFRRDSRKVPLGGVGTHHALSTTDTDGVSLEELDAPTIEQLSPPTTELDNPFDTPSASRTSLNIPAHSAIMSESDTLPDEIAMALSGSGSGSGSGGTEREKANGHLQASRRPMLQASSSSSPKKKQQHAPPKPLDLPPPREITSAKVERETAHPPEAVPQPLATGARSASPEREEMPPVRWWHEWLCGCGEGPDRGGDYQAGRTNPFE